MITVDSNLTTKNSIHIACDHGGVELKEAIKSKFSKITFEDLGTDSPHSVNYPDFAHSLCDKLIKVSSLNPEQDPSHFGILICGTGQGMALTANKHSDLRAALCWSKDSAYLARSHNNAQILCLGARLLSEKLAHEIIHTFLSTPFEGGRHIERINNIPVQT